MTMKLIKRKLNRRGKELYNKEELKTFAKTIMELY